jgi:hypothetical protein
MPEWGCAAGRDGGAAVAMKAPWMWFGAHCALILRGKQIIPPWSWQRQGNE